MSSSNTPQPANSPLSGPQTGVRIDGLTIGILAAFVGLSLVALWLLWPDFEINREVAPVGVALRNEDYGAAIPHLRALTQKQPTEVRWWRDLSTALHAEGDLRGAIEALEKTQELAPDANYARQFALIYGELEEFDKARPYLEIALKGDPKNPALNFYLGRDLLDQGNLREAALAFMATSSSPRWNERAEMYRQEIQVAILGEDGATTARQLLDNRLFEAAVTTGSLSPPIVRNSMINPLVEHATSTSSATTTTTLATTPTSTTDGVATGGQR